MKKLFTLTAAALIASAQLSAQIPDGGSPRKWDHQLERLLQQRAAMATAPAMDGKAVVADTVLHVIIRTNDAQTLAQQLRAEGHAVTVISEQFLTARLPLSVVPQVSLEPSVRRINASRRHRSFMNKARVAVGADKIHAGEGLKTPYTGKGVVIGVIDQGFQYNHIAFNDKAGKSRLLAVWDQNGKKKPVFGLTQEKHDGMVDAYGHATHVTAIAAGSDQGNGLQGMAPEADLIVIPSTFEDADILSGLHFIDSVATAQGKPWVTNMSFGSTVGAHDGTSDHDQAAAAVLHRGKGRVITAAMGNDAESKVHAHHKFTADNETVYLLFEPSVEKELMFDIWGMATDSTRHLKVTPYVHEDGGTGKRPLSESSKYAQIWSSEINQNNKKENYFLYSDKDDFFSNITAPIVVVEIQGNKGDEFHAWIADGFGTILREVDEFKGVAPDNNYSVGEGGASIPGAVAVGAYVTALSWEDYRGTTRSNPDSKNKAVGEIATFSSHGPSLSNEKKPTIAAPGSFLSAAFNRFSQDFDRTSVDITGTKRVKNETFYYGVMEGTSMASPAAAGVVALWLEANPNLSYQDVHEIIRKTAVKDTYTGAEEWNHISGYGKLDAYAGLKAALEKVTGLHAVQRSATPVSLLRTATDYHLLFGSQERHVLVQVLGLNGRLIESRSIGAVNPGTEVVLSLDNLPAGVSLLRITTPAATVTHKLVK